MQIYFFRIFFSYNHLKRMQKKTINIGVNIFFAPILMQFFLHTFHISKTETYFGKENVKKKNCDKGAPQSTPRSRVLLD